jgi:methionine biosynthesis protein MetW
MSTNPNATMNANPNSRIDLQVIADLIPAGTRVLDVGCGDGTLLDMLVSDKQVDGRGVEIEQQNVNICVSKGLSVIQGDADKDLVYYPDRGFDVVVLAHTLQATRNPRDVLEQLLRIGDRAIVSIPNFGYWRMRAQLMFNGRMPETKELPYTWYDTPNIHFCTIRDFVNLCEDVGATVEKAFALDGEGNRIAVSMPWWFWNFFGQQAVFQLKR